jgi:ABC-type transporter Mla subunit MlaD
LQNIETLTSDDGKLGQSLNHLAQLTGPEGSLSKTFQNTEKFTSELTRNNDAAAIMRNFRDASENLNRELTQIGRQFSVIGGNLEQASDTVKHQPWRLVWPTTKKYPDGVKPTPTPRASPTPSRKSTTR